jgi:hypothetical protein
MIVSLSGPHRWSIPAAFLIATKLAGSESYNGAVAERLLQFAVFQQCLASRWECH